MPILGIFGGQDRGIPVESVREFEMALQALGKTHEIVIYEDADHAFANPSGTRYQPEAAADAWQRTLAFLDAHL
jgi:carboxymethylenebutenolidase